MGRPRIGEERLEKFSMMLPPAMLRAIDDLTQERRKAQPYTQVERSSICRELLAYALAHVRNASVLAEADQEPATGAPPAPKPPRARRTARKVVSDAA